MAEKKKAPATRSAKSTTLAGKKAGTKVAAAKKPAAGRASAAKPDAASKATAKKPAAKVSVAAKAAAPKKETAAASKIQAAKPEAKAPVPSKAKQPVAKTAGTAAPVKKPVSAAPKVAPRTVAHKPAVAAAARAAVAAPVRAVAAAVKPSNQKITAPVQQQAPKVGGAEKPAVAADLTKKPVSQRHGFKANEFVVYPAHGVGKIIAIEEQEIAGMALELFVINFEKEKLTLRVPTGKLESVGMRKLAEEPLVKKAMEILKGRARVKRTMWSRRAQEYVAKINSGDLVSIAEVVRDLYRSEAQPEQSYSERQLYEDALDRMAREIAAVEKLDERGAVQRITDVLSKSARGRRLAAEAEAEAGAAAEADTDDDGDDSETKAA